MEAKIFAPGEARTPDLRISLSVLTYKYDALTDCATRSWYKLNGTHKYLTRQTLRLKYLLKGRLELPTFAFLCLY